jgi:sugar lactone lactonase YvrE
MTLGRPARSLLGRAAIAGLLVMALVPGSTALAAAPFPSRIDLPDGWRPEGITNKGTTLFAGSLADGAIYAADLKTGDGDIFIEGGAGRVAVGIEYEADHDRLWVAGGPTGAVRAYDATSGDLLATYQFSPAVFLNDLVATDDAVYVTDSGIQQLDVIPLGAGGALPAASAAFTLPISGPDLAYVANQFNGNGIVEARGWLILVQSNTGQLFRIDPDTGDATLIDTGGYSLSFGDGLEVRGNTLWVVRNQLATIARLRLGPGLLTASLVSEITAAPGVLDVPTTLTDAAGSLYAVNARFNTPPTPDTPYWITRLPTS